MQTSSYAGKLARLTLDGDLIKTGDAGYDRFRRVWNGLADRRPAAIVRAKSTADVVKTVRFAATHDALLAVRGGGHSLPGLSTCDDGIVLDLSLLNTVSVDVAQKTAAVAGGALLADVDAAGADFGLYVPAGVVSHTGAGGLTLGGGMGWLSRRFGLTIDNLLAADIVTADGNVRHVDANVEPQLFWAIRGGGGNFGVVTKFSYRMHEIGPVLVRTWKYDVADADTVLRGFRMLAAKAPRNLTSSFVLNPQMLVVTAFWSGSPDFAETSIAPFGALGSNVTGDPPLRSFIMHQKRSDELAKWGKRYYAKGGYLADVDDKVIACMKSALATAPTPDSEFYVLQLGGAIADVGEDATAYTGRAAAFYWIVQPIWETSADDETCIVWGRQSAGKMAALSLEGNYVNEQADAGQDVAVKAYGADKYRRLAEIKKRYDPGNLFRLNQNIVPA